MEKSLKVATNKIIYLGAVFVNASQLDKNEIQEEFKKIIQPVDANNLLTCDNKFIGIINPYARLYQAAITLQSHKSAPKEVNTIEIEGVKFAIYKIKGVTAQTFNSFHAFYELWLQKNTYRIKQSYALEILSQNPLIKSYYNTMREIYIAIEPA